MGRGEINMPKIAREQGAMQRKNFYLTEELLERAEALAKRLQSDFSQILRQALQEFVEKKEREDLEKEVARACENYREFNKKLSKEWGLFETRMK
jgi:metal-responsive CopG/Arc/MetJ family transcriptional regulator